MDTKLTAILPTLIMALEASMCVVKNAQLAGMTSPSDNKADGTIVTPTDKKSELDAKQFLRSITGVRIHGEEDGESGTGDLVIYVDPLDGTRPFAIGALTSTVIIAVYNAVTKKVVACLVGEPISGRIWHATEDEPTYLINNDSDGKKVTVWGGDLNFKSAVFTDFYPSFTKGGRIILNNTELSLVNQYLNEKTGTLMLGSNGIHHTLVANGGNFCAGAITTAIGGPWDVCPVLLVLQAGGCARAFSVNEDNKLVEKDPLEVESYDILITANNEATMRKLVAGLHYSKIHD